MCDTLWIDRSWWSVVGLTADLAGFAILAKDVWDEYRLRKALDQMRTDVAQITRENAFMEPGTPILPSALAVLALLVGTAVAGGMGGFIMSGASMVGALYGVTAGLCVAAFLYPEIARKVVFTSNPDRDALERFKYLLKRLKIDSEPIRGYRYRLGRVDAESKRTVKSLAEEAANAITSDMSSAVRVRPPIERGIFLVLFGFALQIVGAWPCD